MMAKAKHELFITMHLNLDLEMWESFGYDGDRQVVELKTPCKDAALAAAGVQKGLVLFLYQTYGVPCPELNEPAVEKRPSLYLVRSPLAEEEIGKDDPT